MVESGTALVIGNRECIGSREDKPPREYFRIYIETMHEAMALGGTTVTTQLAFWVKCNYTSVIWHKRTMMIKFLKSSPGDSTAHKTQDKKGSSLWKLHIFIGTS